MPGNITAAVLYTIAIPLALVGNILVIYILYKKPETRRLTSFMYVNLAVADLTVTVVVMPQSLAAILTGDKWMDGTFGELLAKIIVYSFYVALTGSVFSLTAIAFDSFFSIARSMQAYPRLRNKRTIVPCIWLCSMCLMVPWLVIPKVNDSYIAFEFSQFGEIQASVRGVYLFIVGVIYILPLTTMCFLYGYVCHKLRSHTLPGEAIKHDKARHRAKATQRQVICMSIAIVFSFALSWLPAHVFHVMLAIDLNFAISLPKYLMLICYWCGHSNSAVNPWMLIYFKKRFRAVFRKMLTTSLSRMSSKTMNGTLKKPESRTVMSGKVIYQFTSSV